MKRDAFMSAAFNRLKNKNRLLLVLMYQSSHLTATGICFVPFDLLLPSVPHMIVVSSNGGVMSISDT